jgi:hypothetical protein
VLALAVLTTVTGLSLLWAFLFLLASTLPWGPDAPTGPHVDAVHRADITGTALCAAVAVLCLVFVGIVAFQQAVPLGLQLAFVLVVVASVALPAVLAGSMSPVELVRCAITLAPLAVIQWRTPLSLRATGR